MRFQLPHGAWFTMSPPATMSAWVACLARLARERPLLVRNLDLGLLLLALKPEPGSVDMVKNEGRRFCVTPRPGRVALVVHTVVTLELGYVSIVGAVPTRRIADCLCA